MTTILLTAACWKIKERAHLTAGLAYWGHFVAKFFVSFWRNGWFRIARHSASIYLRLLLLLSRSISVKSQKIQFASFIVHH